MTWEIVVARCYCYMSLVVKIVTPEEKCWCVLRLVMESITALPNPFRTQFYMATHFIVCLHLVEDVEQKSCIHKGKSWLSFWSYASFGHVWVCFQCSQQKSMHGADY